MNGSNNPQWKGDAVSYGALHDYVKFHLPKTPVCNTCHQDKPLDLANISQTYQRDLSDWEWLCRRCHMKKDGRIEKLHTPENHRKISEALKGRVRSPEHCRKLSLALKGRRHTDEWKRKMSEIMKRSKRLPPSNIGRKHSPESIAKMKQIASSRPRDEKGMFHVYPQK